MNQVEFERLVWFTNKKPDFDAFDRQVLGYVSKPDPTYIDVFNLKY